MTPQQIKKFSEDWRRPIEKGRDLGLQYWPGPIPGDEVRLFGRWFQVQAVQWSRGQPMYEMALL